MVIVVIVVIVVIEVIMVIMDASVAMVFMFVERERTDINKYLFVKGTFRNSCDVLTRRHVGIAYRKVFVCIYKIDQEIKPKHQHLSY